MKTSDAPFTVGIEEEYLLVDLETRGLVTDPPAGMFDGVDAEFRELIRPEFLKSQVEVGTPVCLSIGEARNHLRSLRRTVAEVAATHGLAPIAASTHPFSEWQDQQHTDKERYHILARDMQAVARRLVICGMHVHVGLEDDELRMDMLNQVTYFMPHLLALSTSSPFWRGQNTGLKSYRLSVFDELPRTGLPESFDSFLEYQRHLDVLLRAGVIEDPSMLWWDIRPSAKFPTLEMRITDVCTRLDDAITIAALYYAILGMLRRLRRDNQRWRCYAAMLVNENRWRAQRYGLDEGLVDFGKGELVPCPVLLEELIALVEPDATAMGCLDEILMARDIVSRGTSAHRQLAVYEDVLAKGGDDKQALVAVVDMLITETVEGL